MISWLFTTARYVPPRQAQRLRARAHHQIAADQRVGLARGDPDRADVAGFSASRQWMCTAPPFWARPAISIIARALAVEMRGHRQERADGDDAGAADAGDDDVPGAVDRRQVRLGQMSGIQLAVASSSPSRPRASRSWGRSP
jgi:hypothetical protein